MKATSPRPRRIRAHPLDPGLALVELTKGHFAVISAVDAIAVGQFNWFAYDYGWTVYASRGLLKSEGRGRGTVTLHRFVGELMGLDPAKEVDHRNCNGLDCQRSNLREATASEQRFNQRLSKANKSGVKGVSWDKRRKKWAALIKANGRRYHLGRFDNLNDAASVVAAERERLHGQFARLQ